jgi:hypothetical protein
MDASDLENAINSAKSEPVSEKDSGMSRDEEIGFHKGALNTLAAERNELVKIVGNVEAIISAHVKRLKELGVELR